MQRLPLTVLLSLSLCVLPPLAAASAKSAPPPAGKSALSASVAGEYTGTWSGREESTGALRIKLWQDASAVWLAEVMFTYEGADVPTTMKSVKVEGTKVELVFSWVVQGTAAESRVTGELTGDVLEGIYQNTTQEGPARGTWKVKR
jgi:hypothetical protein